MSVDRYPKLVRRLHWITAGLFVWQWLSRGLAKQLPAESGVVFHLNGMHTVGGLLILALAVTRIVVRIRRGSLGWPIGMGLLQRCSAAFVHGALYVIMMVEPMIGLAAVRDPEFATVHVVTGWVALGVIGVHVGAAVWHRLVARDDVFNRIAW